MRSFFADRLGSGTDRAVKLTLLVLSGLVFVWFFLPFPVYGVLNIGNLTGMLVSGGAFAAVLYFPELRAFVVRRTRRRAGRLLFTALGALLLAAVCVAGVLTARIVAAASRAPQGSPTVVVLGCKVRGTQPSLMLRRRIDAAAAYLRAHPDAACVLSGGQGEDEEISEARCMFNELTAMGIVPDRLFVEDRSVSTEENLAFSMDVIRENGLPEAIAVVTDGFHQYRASLYAAGYAEAVYAVSVASPVILLPTYVVREWYGILKAALLDGV